MVNKQELKAVITLFGDRQSDLAAVLHMAPTTLSNKINGKAFFSTKDIETIAERYNLSPTDIPRIFFTQQVAHKATEKRKKQQKSD